MKTFTTSTTSVSTSRRPIAAHRPSDRRGQFASRTDICSDGVPVMDCPFCSGPESD
jgi:hypothetical protein